MMFNFFTSCQKRQPNSVFDLIVNFTFFLILWNLDVMSR